MSNKPVHEAKLGRVRGAVWMNESDGKQWPSVTFSKLFKDKEGKWADSSSFSRDDLPLLIKVADELYTYLYKSPAKGEAE